ncbi:MAG TPA: MFS transporter [Tepidisphaeraceae bacterium]|nr:MFS transporter [Tepidisphaeraceae bacterium]
MSHQDDLPSIVARPAYPPGFRPRRGLNWAFLGLLYTSYYLCRYNFPIANKLISDQFHFSREQMGVIITTTMLAYACGQLINGLIADRIGGKRAMLIGAVGTIIANTAFGAASFVGLLWLFVALWGVNGYIQSFGAPGMVKINTAWFDHHERGGFAGIFGFMINLGRFGIYQLGPALLAGFTFLGLIRIGPLHWRWLFWAPSIICFFVAIGMAIFVKQTPEEAGFYHMAPGKGDKKAQEEESDTQAKISTVLVTILSHPGVWFTGMAYACTGAVRQAVDQWFPRYMLENYHVKMEGAEFQWLAFLIPFVASLGSLLSGYASDLLFQSKRAPVAAILYLLETVIIISAAQFHSSVAAIVFFVLIAFTANSTHSLLGSAAAMDIGGRKMSGFSSGVIDSFQYFGGSLAGILVGALIDRHGWHYYWYFMAPFGIIGGLLMIFAGHTITERAEHEPPPVVIVDSPQPKNS